MSARTKILSSEGKSVMEVIKMIHKISMLNILKLKYNLLLLIMSLFLIISLFSIFIYSESNLEKLLSNDSENRTYTISYPLESNSELLMSELAEIKEIENVSHEKNDNFGLHFIKIVFKTYKGSEKILEDLKMLDSKIEVLSKDEAWQIKIMKNLSSIASVFMLITLAFGGGILFYFITKLVKELNSVFCLLNILGYRMKHLFFLSFYKIFWINTGCFCIAYGIENMMIEKVMNYLLSIGIEQDVKNIIFIKNQNMLTYGFVFYLLMMVITAFLTYVVIKRQRENWREMA